ncbi:hypothetical protein P9112_006446 [Eukaryota sp. TZLM1-RC]
MFQNDGSSSSEITGCSRGVKKRKKKPSTFGSTLVLPNKQVSLPLDLTDAKYKYATLPQRKELAPGWISLLRTTFKDDPVENECVHLSHYDETQPHCHVSLITNEENQVVCGVSIDVFPHNECVLIGYLATHSDYKRQGLASRVWKDSMIHVDGKFAEKPLYFAEVSLDPYSGSARGFWSSKGFRRLAFEYYLPQEYRKKPCLEEEYMLTVCVDSNVDQVPASRIIAFLQEYYDWCKADDAEVLDVGIVDMLDQLRGLDFVDLVDIPQ